MNVAVLVSGGVDSSVALALLKEQGHQVKAFYLKIWLEDELSYLGDCPWQEDLDYIQKVCAQFDVQLEVVSMQQVYWQKVVAYTIEQVKAGLTPNPDVLCNQQVKFGAFYDYIADKGFDFVASGHYAQVEHLSEISYLKRAPDLVKDQTYFLCQLSQAQLRKILFPIGHLEKWQVRQLAQDFKLPNKDRKDSQGICFLGKFKFSEFLHAKLGEQQGDLIEFETGYIMGRHPGFYYFTIGQRQGIGLSGGPWYVVDKDPVKNIVYISKQYHDAKEHKSGVIVRSMNWISGKPKKFENITMKFRHGADFHAVYVVQSDDGLVITLYKQSQQGIAAGQFAVLYDGDICLGGGVIDKAF
ncbi:MAG: tRNA 2-thiouridine(34) synthase MnmA [Candidatus Chromulinivorax sp.]